jgi:hypothetical protein
VEATLPTLVSRSSAKILCGSILLNQNNLQLLASQPKWNADQCNSIKMICGSIQLHQNYTRLQASQSKWFAAPCFSQKIICGSMQLHQNYLRLHSAPSELFGVPSTTPPKLYEAPCSSIKMILAPCNYTKIICDSLYSIAPTKLYVACKPICL